MQIRVPVTRQYRNVLSFLLLIFRIFNKERWYREKLKHKAKKSLLNTMYRAVTPLKVQNKQDIQQNISI